MKFQGYNNRFVYSKGGGFTGVYHYLSLMSLSGVNMVYVGNVYGSPFKQNSTIYNTVYFNGEITPDVLRENSFRTDLFIIEKTGRPQSLIGWSKNEGIDIPFLFLQSLDKGKSPERDVTMDTDWYFYQNGQPSIKSLMDLEERFQYYEFADLATGHSQSISTYINTLRTKEKIREYFETHGRKGPMSGGAELSEE